MDPIQISKCDNSDVMISYNKLISDLKNEQENESETNKKIEQMIETMGMYLLNQFDTELDEEPNSTELDEKPSNDTELDEETINDIELDEETINDIELDEEPSNDTELDKELNEEPSNDIELDKEPNNIYIKNTLSHNTIDRILSPLHYSPYPLCKDKMDTNKNSKCNNEGGYNLLDLFENNKRLFTYGTIGTCVAVSLIYLFSRKK